MINNMNKLYKKSFGIVSLGCPKNTVDSEVLKGGLIKAGFVFNEVPEEAEVLIVNTCGFIGDAKEESIDTIMEAINLKNNGNVKKIIATGCLTERYTTELQKELVEVDRIFGVDSQDEIIRYLSDNRSHLDDIENIRKLITPDYSAYLKIAEGCDNKCSFCSIPIMRGSQISRSFESILSEAEYLQSIGVKEVILTAQDLTRYGTDLFGKRKLFELLDELLKRKYFHWVRIMYSNPDFWNSEIVGLFRKYPELCTYIDLPIQHASDRILKLMNRGKKQSEIWDIIKNLRDNVPNIALRTSVMVGFPTESEKDFDELLDFIGQVRFDRLGVFTYSEEEGTEAESLKDNISQEEKDRRQEMIMELQYDISSEFAQSKIDQDVEILIEGKNEDKYFGRSIWDAPEVDCSVEVSSEKELKTGEFYKMKVTGTNEFDLIGTI